jgi:hypothetical protein
VFVPAPPGAEELGSVRTWIPGHTAPTLAIEVVSETEPRKDYTIAPEKYAASGTKELVVFDPLLAGPRSLGGPFRLQVWRRRVDGHFVREYIGDGPAYCATLDAWLVAVDEGKQLRIAADREATDFWMTAEEAERTAKESERAAKEAALARVAELEALLARRA